MTLTIGVGAHPTLQAQVTNPHLSPLTQMITTFGSSVLRRQHTQVIPARATVAFRPCPFGQAGVPLWYLNAFLAPSKMGWSIS